MLLGLYIPVNQQTDSVDIELTTNEDTFTKGEQSIVYDRSNLKSLNSRYLNCPRVIMPMCTEQVTKEQETTECTCGHGDFLKQLLGNVMCALENEHDLTTTYKQANILTQSSSKRRGSRTVRKLKLKRLACVRPRNVKLSKGLTTYVEKDCLEDMLENVTWTYFRKAKPVDQLPALDSLKPCTKFQLNKNKSSRCV